MNILKKIPIPFFLLLIGILSMIRLFVFDGLPNGHDISMEIVRLIEYRHALSTQIIPRFAEHIYLGYGAPVFVFYAPLFLATASIFSFLVSVDAAVKIVLLLLSCLGVFGAYYWISALYSRHIALLTSVLFAFIPYKWVDVYARNAFAEYTAFMLLPCVLAVITHFLMRKEIRYREYMIAVAVFSGYILAHNITLLISIPFLVAYVVCLLVWTKSFNAIKPLCISGAVSMGLTSFFWLPAFFEKSLIQTTELLTGKFRYEVNFAELQQMFGDMGSMYYIPIVLCIFIIVPLFAACFKKLSHPLLYGGSLLWVLVSFFVMFPVSGLIWEHLEILHFVQFPWRFMVIFSVGVLPLFAAFLSLLKGRFAHTIMAVATLAVILPSFVLYMKEDSQFTYYSENITSEKIYQENMRVTVGDEYLPLDTEHTFTQLIERKFVTSSNVALTPLVYEKKMTLPGDASVALPFYDFPYWEVYVDEKRVPYDKTLSSTIAVSVPAGTHDIQLRLGFSSLHLLGIGISGGVFLILLVYSMYRFALIRFRLSR